MNDYKLYYTPQALADAIKDVERADNAEGRGKIIRLSVAEILPPDIEIINEEHPTDKPLILKQLLSSSGKRSTEIKRDFAEAIALVLCDTRNTLLFLKLMPQNERRMWEMIIENLMVNIITATTLLGNKDGTLSFNPYSSPYRFSETIKAKFPWFEAHASYDNNFNYHYYITINRMLYHYFVRAHYASKLASATSSAPPTNAVITNLEADAISSIPTIMAMLDNDAIKPGKTKLLTQSAMKQIRRDFDLAPLPTLADDEEMMRELLLGTPCAILHKTQTKKSINNPADMVRDVLTAITHRTEHLVPIVASHINPLPRVEACNNYAQWMLWCITNTLTTINDKWITMSAFEIMARVMLKYNIQALHGFSLERQHYAINANSGIEITYDNILQQAGYPMLRAAVYILASLGIVEIATTDKVNDSVSVWDGIVAFKVTPLGRYALKIDDKYTPPVGSDSKGADFELSETHLMIRVLNPKTGLLPLLKLVATDKGNNRWEVSPKSILASCSGKKDLLQQIDMFKNFLCADPPEVWKRFFATITDHIEPLQKVSPNNYKIFKVDPANTALTTLLVTDERLLSLSLRAEGHLLLVPTNAYPNFIARLKELGYLQ